VRLILQRQHFFDTYTIGSLFLDGAKLCWTLEDKVREHPGMPVSQWKVMGDTAIPVGTYDLSITMSSRFGKELPLLANVPGFAGVRIHSGNTDEDTEGCILVGLDWQGDDFIGHSRDAFAVVNANIRHAIDSGEPVSLEVS
jgi:Family of unknown function (DUF5675)